ncbi:uncharacterized protein LOC108678503 [Hyalella azteca]|uniref:Uncharacterized protein LOC108678503 n=1 Tax=Hyalella azteca TaxID=294128 RepID=A0A8B7P8F3_HYAAZ|nr:uncharacterized protein LOC108678503 [Hyalella azteca]
MESMDCKQDLCTGSYIAPMDPAMEEVFQGDHLASGNKEFNLDELLEFLKSPTRREKSTFAVIESNKDRGKPYFVERDPNMITSKPETQIPVELMGGQAGDRIRISLM